MKKIILQLTFAYLTSFTFTSGISAIAGSCNSQLNKNVKIECAENDSECQRNNAEKHQLDKTVRS